MGKESDSGGWPQSNAGDVELNGAAFFDPNNPKFKCLCNQCHSTTGVRIIAGLLCITVLLELWNLIWHILSANQAGNNSNIIISSVFQLFIGTAITGSVIYALKTENAAFLSPYLLLQAIGLAAVFVIFFALTYITLTNDLATIKNFVESGPQIDLDESNEQYLTYMGWTLIGSCAAVLILQFWLIQITYSCWRFFRDKREFGYSKGYTASFVILKPKSSGSIKKAKPDKNMVNRFIRSMSADELMSQFKLPHRPATATFSAATVSFDCSTRDTIIIA